MIEEIKYVLKVRVLGKCQGERKNRYIRVEMDDVPESFTKLDQDALDVVALNYAATRIKSVAHLVSCGLYEFIKVNNKWYESVDSITEVIP